MTTDIQQANDQGIEIWNNDKADKIRQLFAPNLTNDEFAFFWGLGKSLQANPFTREIWAVKYDKNKPAQVFLGRDFYRKKAQEQSDYDGHIVDAVYENDEFRVESGTPKHSYNLTDRGKLLGAYCVVYKKDISNAFYVYVELDEYHKGQSTWNEKPATMIKKVAEAQALRGAYQGIFRGTYDESERWDENPEQPVASQRQAIDIDVQTKEEVETQSNSTNGSPDNSIDEDSIREEITAKAKDLWGRKGFYKGIKQEVLKINGEAENMLDLSQDDLLELHDVIMSMEIKAEA